MTKVVALGGCGAVGSVAVKTLAAQGVFSEIVIADMNLERAEEVASQIPSKNVTAARFDADDAESVKNVIKGADIVLNCVGPFYKTVLTILGAVIESGINYVDICDDVDVTFEVLDMDEAAKKAGITAVIGMGGSPGSTNLLAKHISDTFLDETFSIDIFHTHGGESIEGAGVIGHRFHSMSIDIPMFLDGELKYVKFFEESGIALRQDFEFPVVGNVPLYPYPHPEQVTLPKYIDVAQVTNKGSVIPIEYYRFIGELCRLGLGDKEPLEVNGQSIVPRDFATAFVIREREKILKETDFGEQRGAMSVIVKGKKDGEPLEYRAHISSRGRAMREATGLPAAMGVILMEQGKITAKGVLPPEGCIDTADFISLSKKLGAYEEKKEGGLTLEKIDVKGNVTNVGF